MKPNVWERRRARRALVQALYQWEMSATPASDLVGEFKASGALDKADVEFFDDVLRGVTLREPDLDTHFEPLLDRKLGEIDKVELAILRLGTYELKCRIDVPYRVVIDQYVELAKTFGAEESHKYINGVLDRLAKSLRTVETS